MNFRKGYNITSGSVDLVLYSDENGNFKTDALEYGFYTIELQKEGYITSYVLAQAAASNWEESERDLNRKVRVFHELRFYLVLEQREEKRTEEERRRRRRRDWATNHLSIHILLF